MHFMVNLFSKDHKELCGKTSVDDLLMKVVGSKLRESFTL